MSISVTPTVRGSAARTRTRTGCCASTSPRVPTSHDTALMNSTPSLLRSTADHARRSVGGHQLKHSMNYYSRADKAVLQRLLEPSQYTSWAFGRRLRAAGILGSMGSIGDCFDNSMAESFFGTLQSELLDRRRWKTRKELATAVFEYIEGFYNPRRRHSSIGYLSPVDYEHRHHAATVDRDAHQPAAVLAAVKDKPFGRPREA